MQKQGQLTCHKPLSFAIYHPLCTLSFILLRLHLQKTSSEPNVWVFHFAFLNFLMVWNNNHNNNKKKEKWKKKICKIIKQTAEQQIQIHLRFESIKVEVTLASHAPARQPTNRPILLNQPFFFWSDVRVKERIDAEWDWKCRIKPIRALRVFQ